MGTRCIVAKSKNQSCLTVQTLLEIYADFKDSKIDLNKIFELINNTVGIIEYQSDSPLRIRKIED